MMGASVIDFEPSDGGAPAPDARPDQPSPALASLLSFLLPGLGQAAAGRRRRGLLISIPALIAIGAFVILLFGGRIRAAATLVGPGVLEAILIVNMVLAAYHAWAIVDAARVARAKHSPSPTRRGATAAVAALVVIALVAHGTFEIVGIQAHDTILAVFGASDGNGGWAIPSPSFETPSPSPAAPSATPGASPSPTPVPTPEPTPGPAWAADGRLNILLIGGDAGPGRTSLRTDSMEVLSVDVASGRAALFGLPRNLIGVPLPPESAGAFRDGTYPGLLNSLYVYANEHPDQFPGGDARGFRATAGAIQQLIGVPLDGAVVVNLNGFVRLVDAIGGLWVRIPETVVDSHYPLENGSGDIELVIKSGCRHLDGHLALAYARSRHMDSDYGRMNRQQRVLVALARQVDPLALVSKIPELLDIARDDLWTTFQPADAGDLADLLARVDAGSIDEIVFVPPDIPEVLDAAAIAQIRSTVRNAFPPTFEPTPRPTPSPESTPTDHCG